MTNDFDKKLEVDVGGSGSGSWYRWDSKTTTESLRRIDIRWLKNQRCLTPGTLGTLSWSTTRWDGETKQTRSINYRMEADRMILTYRYRVNGGEWQDVEEVIRFDRTPCHYGGFRKWFLCPGCSKRVAVLYRAGKYFLCRHCQGLCYTSQKETEIDRMTRKQRKIRKRLGAINNLTFPAWIQKPKGMHQKTFDRLVAQGVEISTYKWKLIGKRVEILKNNLELIKDRLGMK